MPLTFLHPRIAWRRCNRRRWPPTHELSFTTEQVRKQRHVLLVVWAGRGTRTTPVGDITVQAGSCHWSKPGFDYRCVQSPDDPLGITAIHFDLVDEHGMLQLPGSEPEPLPEILHTHYPHLAQTITGHVADLAMNIRAGEHIQDSTLTAAEALFATLLRQLLAETELAGGGPSPTEWTQVTRYIHDHLRELPSVEELAARLGYSRSHFSRAFRAQVGLAPLPFIINARTALAKELLRDTDLTIGQIATHIGYPDTYSFSRQFREVAGQTPSAYRAAAR